MRFTNLFLGIILLVATGSAAHASLSAINTDRLPPGKDVAQLLDDLKVLETVAANWSPEWRHEPPKEEAAAYPERQPAGGRFDGKLSISLYVDQQQEVAK